MNTETRIAKLEAHMGPVEPTEAEAVETERALQEQLLAQHPALAAWLRGQGEPLTDAELNEVQLRLVYFPYAAEWFKPGDDARALAQASIVLAIIARRAADRGEVVPDPRDDEDEALAWLRDYASTRDPISHCLLHNALLGLAVTDAWAAGQEAVFQGQVIRNAFGERGVMPHDN
jgi:hypothetical protein